MIKSGTEHFVQFRHCLLALNDYVHHRGTIELEDVQATEGRGVNYRCSLLLENRHSALGKLTPETWILKEKKRCEDIY